MKSICNLIIAALLAITITSCKTIPNVEPSTGASSAALNSVVDNTNDHISNIKRDAQEIKTDAAGIILTKNNSPQQMVDRINANAENIIESANAVEKENGKLKKLSAEVIKLEKSLTNLQIAMDEAKIAAMERLYGYITLFWVLGFLLIAAGAAVAFFLNKSYGGMLALLGVLMLGFASAAHRYMDQIAMVGAILLIVGFVAAVAMIVWSTVNSKRNATAVKEIVEMIQILKETMTDDEQKRIFGPDGVASTVQSDLTKEIIAKIKEKNGFKKLEEARRIALGGSPSSGGTTGHPAP